MNNPSNFLYSKLGGGIQRTHGGYGTQGIRTRLPDNFFNRDGEGRSTVESPTNQAPASSPGPLQSTLTAKPWQGPAPFGTPESGVQSDMTSWQPPAGASVPATGAQAIALGWSWNPSQGGYTNPNAPQTNLYSNFGTEPLRAGPAQTGIWSNGVFYPTAGPNSTPYQNLVRQLY